MTDINTELNNACDTIHVAARARPGETRDEAIARACNAIALQKRLVKAARTAAADMIAAKPGANLQTDDDHLIPGDQARTVTVALLSEVLEAVAKGVRDRLADIVAENAHLRKEIAELKAVPQLTDGGTWDAQKIFKPGQVVTHDGSAFVCRQANSNARPGESDCWRLMIKRGRDAKDARR